MRVISQGLGVFFALLIASASFGAEFKAGEVIVKYKDGANRSRISMNALYQKSGVKSVHRYHGMMAGFEKLTLQDTVKVQDAIADLLRDDAVEYAEPNYIVRLKPVLNPVSTRDGGGGLPGMPGIPCIPGFNIPGCDPNAKLPCLFPGFPPGCDSGGGPTPGPGPTPPTDRPELKPAPADVDPAVADPQLSDTYGMSKINAVEAWKLYRGSKEFVVADTDTGIDYNHEDLAFNVWRNPNPTKSDVVGFDFIHNDGLPFDDNFMEGRLIGHGTHTAGTIGAVGGNGVGVSGVSQRVSIMAIKILSGDGQGDDASIAEGINYAVDHGARVINASWGGPQGSQVIKDAIINAGKKGVMFVNAAGNDSADIDQPGSQTFPTSWKLDNMINVAATDDSDDLAMFSNYGASDVHVAAPGANILSTQPGGGYQKLDGTSMACPHVVGAAALIWSKKPSMTYQDVKDLLLKTVDKLPALSGKTITGGRINVLKALQAIK